MNDNRNWDRHSNERREYDPQRNRHSNHPLGWQENRGRNNMQDNYDYGNYTSGFGGNRNYDQNFNQGYGSYEGAPTGFQAFHPNNPNPNDDMHGYNDYGYAGRNRRFENAADEFRGENWPEANNGFGVGTGRTDDYYAPRNDWQQDRSNNYNERNNYYTGGQSQRNARPMGQTMDSWDNDDNHWHTQKFNRSGFGAHREDRNRDYHYRPQNQGYFGGNMPPHSGGDLYNERFRNEDDTTRYNPEEKRWHADSLSDRNIEGWGR